MSFRNYGRATTVRRWRHLSPRHLRGLLGPGSSSLLLGSPISPALLRGEKVRRWHSKCLGNDSTPDPSRHCAPISNRSLRDRLSPLFWRRTPARGGVSSCGTRQVPPLRCISHRLLPRAERYLPFCNGVHPSTNASRPLLSQGSSRKRLANASGARQHCSECLSPFWGARQWLP